MSTGRSFQRSLAVTYASLAAENANMAQRFLEKPPGSIAYPADSAAIMALYPRKPEAEDPEEFESGRTPQEQQADAQVFHGTQE